MKLTKAEWYDVPHYWPDVEGFVHAALAHGSIIYTPDDIRTALLRRQMQLWLAVESEAIKACAVTRLDTHERVKICAMVIIGGEDLDNWIHFHAAIESWAADENCNAIEGAGRKGWQRVMKDRGYEPVFVVYRKMLT